MRRQHSEPVIRATAIDEVLARRFRIDPPPTLVARRHHRPQGAFSRMHITQPMRGRSLAVRPEAAFSFHVPLTVPFFSELWMAGKRKTPCELRRHISVRLKREPHGRA